MPASATGPDFALQLRECLRGGQRPSRDYSRKLPWRGPGLEPAACIAIQQSQGVPVLAPLWKRIMAFGADGAVVYASWLPGLVGGARRGAWAWVLANAAATLFFIARGASLGKWLMGIRQIVINERLDGSRHWEPLGVLKYLFNVLVVRNFFLGVTAGLSAVWPLFDKNNQFIGDKILGIFTVEEDSLSPPKWNASASQVVASRL